VLPPNPTVEQVVEHVNANVDKVQGYRAGSVRIRANNLPGLSGHLVVARDHRLRLEVTSLAGKEVDLGSNDEVFWLWARRNEPAGVYYAAHADMGVARQKLPMPFEPEWLMEALGVMPLSAEDVRLEGASGKGSIKLVSHHQLSDGQQIQKVIAVDPCRGTVMEHSIYDAHGQLMVRALLQDYRLDTTTGAMLARHIKLDWPQAKMSLAMDLGNVEVNPPAMPAKVWEMPVVPGCPLVDLGRRGHSEELYATPGKTRVTDQEIKLGFHSADDELEPPRMSDASRGRPIAFDEPQFQEPAVPLSISSEPAPTTTVRPF